MKESIVRLRALEKQRFAYRYALNVVDFDAETVAPEGSADGRAEACEVLSRADFDLLVNDNTAALLRQAAQDAETEQERAEVRELQRAYDQISKIPADEYAAFTKLTQQSIPPGSRPSAPTISAYLHRIWRRSWLPAAPRPATLPPTATLTRCCWISTSTA